ncbi:CHAT domain-containing tetratricopeptide repeat protein [Streptomyces sp. NBC_01205]|uniref:CHAT domain-containing tetratricopeptide repeat protein n=1 Tax=Streptomyces sp. NBC_01205 TaxID=2903771 RepID=UPI002E144550|nr:CHAT domain-containing protein [Streptomyces sp. NBC_01205]
MSDAGDPERTVRPAAVQAMEERLERVMLHRDLTPVVEAGALDDAQRLAELLSGEDDLVVRHLLGWFHWFRHQAIPAPADQSHEQDQGQGQGHDRGQPDLRAAVGALTACFLAGDDDLPVPLLPLIAESAAGYAFELLADLRESDDPVRLAAVANLWQRIVAALPAGHPHRAVHLSALGNVLRIKFGRGGPPADLDTAIDRFREALSTAPDGPGRAMYLFNLADALRVRSQRAGAAADLDGAVGLLRQAAQAAPEDGLYQGLVLTTLARALLARFERAGAVADLDGAIAGYREAVHAFPGGHPGRTEGLSSLGNALRIRSERTGSVTDLDAAVEAGRRAVDAAPAGHPGLPTFLSNLGLALQARFLWTGLPEDVDAAIETWLRAVQAAAPGHPDRAMFLSHLGGGLRARYERIGGLADLNAAVDRHRQAVDAVPAEHPDRARYLSHLGLALRTRFGRTGDRTDLDEAIAAGRLASEAVPADHCERATYLDNLADALLVRFDRDRTAADREAAVQAWSTASAAESSPLPVRIHAGMSAARLLARSGKAEEAARAADTAVRLLPRTAQRRPERPDRQHAIGDVAGLTGTAAALALAAPGGTAQERAERALGMLEVGRAVLLGQALDDRSDLTELRERHPELARRFTELRDGPDRVPNPLTAAGPGDGAGPPLPRHDAVRHERPRLAAEFSDLLAEIRAREGFASFALPPTIDELRAEAVHGPIVVFNVSTHRSDALLLTSEGIRSLPLPRLDRTTVIDRVNAFRQALHTTLAVADPAGSVEAQAVLVDVLEWLWDAAAGPVLDALGLPGPPPPEAGGTADLPRVWWAPGGLLGLLPLHAAGHHTDAPHDPCRRTVMDRVVSSYTPTVRALRHARERGRHRHDDPAAAGRALIVAMPTTPGLPGGGRLRFVDAEAAMLEARFPRPIVLRESRRPGARSGPAPAADPTKANVLAHLPLCAIAHFACHGTSDPTDPSRSRLLLHDHADDPLTVKSLAPVALDHARLAYLSACRTAATDTADLLDEAVHLDEAVDLSSAFQLAGFPHVIGTLWEIDDQTAVGIARAFYDGLRTESAAVDPDRAARALHAAVRQVRDGDDLPPGHDRRRAPLLWAAHLHAGA